MSKDANSTYELLCDHARETALLTSIEGLLEWDERVGLPSAAGEYRAEQITYLAGMGHKRQTDPRIGDWLGELADSPLAADPHSDTGATIRQLRRNYEKKSKLPQSLVEELARTAVLGQQAWTDAREKDDFALFQPLLERTIALKQQEADAVGYKESRYDALLDDYEPDELTSSVSRVLADLRDQLVPLVAEIGQSERQAKVDILARSFPIDVQESFGREVASKIGFDFNRGRLDVTHHPFFSGVE